MTVPYQMLKFGHFTGMVRNGDIVSGLLNERRKVRFYKKNEFFCHLIGYNGVYRGG